MSYFIIGIMAGILGIAAITIPYDIKASKELDKALEESRKVLDDAKNL